MDKSPEAFRTISEVADLLETPAHVLRFWESRFTQIKPVKRAGGRRYYRPADVALLAGIRRLLHDEGMTIRGVQKVLRENGVRHVAALASGQTFVDSDFEELLEAAETADFQPAPQGAEVIPLAAFAPELREVVADAAPKPDAPPLPETAPDVDPGPLPQPGPVEVANPALEDVLPEDMPATAETYAGQPDDVIDDLPEDLSAGPETLASEELPVLPSEDAGLDDLADPGDAEHAPLQADLFADLDPQPLLTALETETVAVEAVEVADFLTDDAVPDTPAPLAEDVPTNLFAPEFAPDQDPESESDSDGLPESPSEPVPLLDLAPDQSEAEAVADDVTGEVEPPSAAKAESPADSAVIWWPAAIRALPRSPLHDAGLALVAARARDLLARLQSHR